MDRYSFLVRLFHPLLHAGLSRRTNIAISLKIPRATVVLRASAVRALGKTSARMGQPAIMKGILNRSAHLLFALGAGKRLGHHFANQHLTGLAGMNVASELVRRGKRSIQQAEGARVSSASR